MAIWPIIVHFTTLLRARMMHGVACEFVRSKDAQKQLARTSLNRLRTTIYRGIGLVNMLIDQSCLLCSF